MSALRSERLDFRLPGDLKALIEAAASYTGQSVSAFAIAALRERALEVKEQCERTLLSDRDRDVFLSILDDDEPSDALLRAAERYRRLIDAGGPDVDDRSAGEAAR